MNAARLSQDDALKRRRGSSPEFAAATGMLRQNISGGDLGAGESYAGD